MVAFMRLPKSIIIGAGPYGLSLAAHLRAQRVPFEIIGHTMDSWKNKMPNGLLLKSEPFASSLWDPKRQYTIKEYFHAHDIPYQPTGRPTPKSTFIAYSEWFQSGNDIDVTHDQLLFIRKYRDSFELLLESGRVVLARQVVVATGGMQHNWIPAALRQLPQPLALHSCQIPEPNKFKGKDVVVVGAGQSAILLAALFAENGADVRVLVRGRQIYWNGFPRLSPSLLEQIMKPESALAAGWKAWTYAEIPQLFYALPSCLRRRIVTNGWGPSGAWWLKNRTVGRVPFLMAHEIESAEERGGRVYLRIRSPEGPIETNADHVIAATGYKFDLKRLQFLDPEIVLKLATEKCGTIDLSRNYESSVPGLYFIGMASAMKFGPVMRFMFGAKHPAAHLSRILMA
jgi:thioredoxin reductase